MITYHLLTRDKRAEIAQFMVDNFFVTEPFGLALGLPLDQVTRWYPAFLDAMLDYSEPVSFYAVDSESQQTVGAIINIIIDPAKSHGPPNMKDFLDPAIEPIKIQIATFLENLEHDLDIAELLQQPADSKIFACLFVSVSENYGGRGIAKQLVLQSEVQAKSIPGVHIAMTDVTSAYSYKVFQKLGYEQLKEVEYVKYEDPEAGPIFKDKEEKLGVHTHARVVAKVLQ